MNTSVFFGSHKYFNPWLEPQIYNELIAEENIQNANS